MPLAGDPERMVNRMTMEDIRQMTDDFITPATAAAVMKMDTGRLIAYARDGQLPFPVVISGNRVKISRTGFLKAFGYEAEERKRKDGIEDQLKELTKEVRVLGVVLMGILLHTAPEIAGKLMEQAEKEGLQ